MSTYHAGTVVVAVIVVVCCCFMPSSSPLPSPPLQSLLPLLSLCWGRRLRVLLEWNSCHAASVSQEVRRLKNQLLVEKEDYGTQTRPVLVGSDKRFFFVLGKLSLPSVVKTIHTQCSHGMSTEKERQRICFPPLE